LLIKNEFKPDGGYFDKNNNKNKNKNKNKQLILHNRLTKQRSSSQRLKLPVGPIVYLASG
jgi:hypothetical protein